MVSNSTADVLRLPVVASQYLRPLDSSIRSWEDAPETSNVSHMVAVRRCFQSIQTFSEGVRHHHVLMKVRDSGTV